ncbi:DUF1905 domain-containing protein [Devosia lucknowensis]|uniref:DUF1905 domain-containing protein n=1 Tax=Devosia lucknowensis TaxID=1096929 RepID=UPI000A394970|nr:DUF1905 domain-containing protein [Devosia lucknowensis]
MNRLQFRAAVIYWRGPAPFLFAAIPAALAADIRALGSAVSYGWGCIPVSAQIGEARFTTSLLPKDGSYLLPLKVAARKAIGPVDVGDTLDVSLDIGTSR